MTFDIKNVILNSLWAHKIHQNKIKYIKYYNINK